MFRVDLFISDNYFKGLPGSNNTLVTIGDGKRQGSKRVEITELGDKRQITIVFASTLSAHFFKPHMIKKEPLKRNTLSLFQFNCKTCKL